MSIIEVTSLFKIYNQHSIPVHALSNIDLQINKSEFTSIVGPSGSGKTTLLNILGGLDEPTSGNVLIKGEEIFQFSEKKLTDFRLHQIGFVFQSFNLIPVLSTLENVSFVLQMQGLPTKECLKRAKELLTQVGLSDQIHKKPAELSGGQQQRVAVARALASKPSFVLADEPTANLDTKSASDLLDIMFEMNQKQGTTFIFSTHDQRVVERAKRVITLVDGKIFSDESCSST